MAIGQRAVAATAGGADEWIATLLVWPGGGEVPAGVRSFVSSETPAPTPFAGSGVKEAAALCINHVGPFVVLGMQHKVYNRTWVTWRFLWITHLSLAGQRNVHMNRMR